MDRQHFLAEFGHIANAPGGIERLRELILQLATQGKLIDSVSTNESAPALLTEVRAIRTQLIADKKIPRDKPFPEISAHEIPSEGPQHWVWVRFGELWQLLSGRDLDPNQYNDSRVGIPYITGASNIENSVINVNRWTVNPVVVSVMHDLLITCKGTIGKTAFNEIGNVHVARQIMAIRNFSEILHTGFLKIWLDGFVSQLIQKSKSMIPGFSREDLVLAIYPLPPLSEQSLIVAKVDELMNLCDKLEAQQHERRKLQNHLRQSTLQAVAVAVSPHELQTTWARLADNFGHLFHTPEDVAELRGLILDMAMRGFLVDQDASEESALALSANIESKKRELSKVKKLKLQKALSTIREDEIPFAVPKGWEWIRLGQIAELINGDRGKNYPNKDEYVSVGVPWINTGHIEPDGTLTRHYMNFISREKFDSLNSGKIEPGDIVYCLRGATFGKTAFVTPYEEGAIASSLMIIRPIISSLSRYLYYYLISPLGRSQIFKFDNGTAQPNLSADSVGHFAYPLPPLKEQSRIAARIEQLLRECDSLESQLRHCSELAGRLAIASISSITGIAAQQEEELMKAPQTELIAPLRLGSPPKVKAQAPLATILARHNGEISAKDLWQRFGGEIDTFYSQLKVEVAHGWILEPTVAEMRERRPDTLDA